MIIKYLFDKVVSFFGLLLLWPVLVIIAIMVKVKMPGGPAFFVQQRVGKDGKLFNCHKFRSMTMGQNDSSVSMTGESRITPFGEKLRRYKLDELPQLWDVFVGNMSFVGPRPDVLAHTEQYSRIIDKYMIRHLVKPGVTGWAQVTGFRGETQELWQMEGRVEHDIWYIQHWSVWLDILIIWRTIKSIFVHDKNAY